MRQKDYVSIEKTFTSGSGDKVVAAKWPDGYLTLSLKMKGGSFRHVVLGKQKSKKFAEFLSNPPPPTEQE